MGFADLLVSRSKVSGLPGVSDLMRERYKRAEKQQPLQPKGTWRSSGLSHLCAREQVYAIRLDRPIKREVDPDQLFNFNEGSGFHFIMQNIVLPTLGVLYGQWECLLCQKLYGTQDEPAARPAKCACTEDPASEDNFRYREYSLYYEPWRLTGHNDGFLKLPGRQGFGVLELKTISERQVKLHKVHTMPKVEHVEQINAYMQSLDASWGVILYRVKGIYKLETPRAATKAKEPAIPALIEYVVAKDHAVVSAIDAKLAQLWDYVSLARAGSEDLPPRVCAVHTCDRAKECGFVRNCFDLPVEVAEPSPDLEGF